MSMLKRFLDKYSDKMFCFSPPVMIFTFVFEILAAFFVWFSYEKRKVTKIVVSLLVFLSIFQLAEYNVCEGAFGLSAAAWSKIGFMSISMLPPLGIYLIQSLSKTKSKLVSKVAFATGGLFITYFLMVTASVSPNVCLGNYVIFKMNDTVNLLYTIYYFGWLLVGVGLAYREFKANQDNLSEAIKSVGIGYLAFMVPTAIVNLIDPETIGGIPSIMCGFAILLAIILVFRVMPKANIRKRPFGLKSALEKVINRN